MRRRSTSRSPTKGPWRKRSSSYRRCAATGLNASPFVALTRVSGYIGPRRGSWAPPMVLIFLRIAAIPAKVRRQGGAGSPHWQAGDHGDGEAADQRHERATAAGKRVWRTLARAHPSGRDRARHPHVPVPALQYSVRLDEGHAADRRLPFCLQIQLRFQSLFLAVLAAAVLRPDPRLAAPARRRGGVPPAAR